MVVEPLAPGVEAQFLDAFEDVFDLRWRAAGFENDDHKTKRRRQWTCGGLNLQFTQPQAQVHRLK